MEKPCKNQRDSNKKKFNSILQALYSAMQELSKPKYSGALLNGIKDSLTPGQADASHAIHDLLRAASLLNSLGLPPAAPKASDASRSTPTPAKPAEPDKTPTPTSTPTPSKADNGARSDDHDHDRLSDHSGNYRLLSIDNKHSIIESKFNRQQRRLDGRLGLGRRPQAH